MLRKQNNSIMLPQVSKVLMIVTAIATLIFTIPSLTIADQQYITPQENNNANLKNTDQDQVQATSQSAGADIYVMPKKNQSQATQAKQSIFQNSHYQQQAKKRLQQQNQQATKHEATHEQLKPINKASIRKQVYAKPPTQESQTAALDTAAQPTATNDAHDNSNTNAKDSNVNTETKVSQYTNEEKIAWFKSCMKSVKAGQGAEFAKDFCGCGWRHIASGELDPALLTSTKAADIKRANNAMVVITQQCMVEVEVNRNRKVEKK